MPSLLRREPDLSPAATRPLGEDPSRVEVLLRLVHLVVALYAFLVAIELMSESIAALADTGVLGGSEGEVFTGVSNPFAGLAIGILFTVLVQSSSTTTSTIVAVVGSGALSVENAVPMILGANIGTTITSTLVSVGHVRRSGEFRRAFAAATVHDFFNIMAVALLLPLELATGFLSRSAATLTGWIGPGGGTHYKSPIKAAIQAGHHAIQGLLEGTGLAGTTLGVVSLTLGVLLTFLCLHQITGSMQRVIAGRMERALNRSLESSGLVPLLIGIAITVAVQSSSITTSLMVPMCAAGVMSLERAFPIMLGANIGTTVTALLASMAQDRPEALTIALVHLLFNASGVLLVYPVPAVRRVPARLATGLATLATRSPVYVVLYVLGAFVALPLAGWWLWR